MQIAGSSSSRQREVSVPAVRHVFMPETSGWDRVHAWQETTGEPIFTFGLREGVATGTFFGTIKREFRNWLEATHAESVVTVYHDGAGADVLGPLDPAARKVHFQHRWVPRWPQALDWYVRCTGKVMVGSPHLASLLHERFAWIPERYIQAVPPPPLAGLEAKAVKHSPSRRTGIWLHGSPWRSHGNRLRAIVDRWAPEAGQLEIIAEGGDRPRWARKAHLTWSMGMPVEFALHRIFTWDSVLLLNDYSLDAPWLRHALDLGCFILVPEGDSPARSGVWTADDAPQPYPWGDIPAAVRLLGEWRGARDSLQPRYRTWVRDFLEPFPDHEAFVRRWQQVIAELAGQRTTRLRKRKAVPDWYPVRLYERVRRLRSGL